LYASAWSAFGGMSEMGVTLPHLLMMRSAVVVPALKTTCFLVVKEVNQAVIGWIAAAFLVFMACGLKSGRAAHLQRLPSALAFAPV
jgi:hypothetical protein